MALDRILHGNLPPRLYAEALAERRSGMDIAAGSYGADTVIGERVEERECANCGWPKWPSTSALCLSCREVAP